MKERNKHTKDCWPNSVQYDLIWGRVQLSNPLSKSSSKEITNGLQEVSTTAHKEQNLISTRFPNLTNEQDTQWFSLSKVITMFPTQENLTTKTLNPKVTSFGLSSFSLKVTPPKNAKKHLNSTQALSKSCHDLPNRDTVGAYDPRYDQPYLENVPNKLKMCHIFPKLWHDWALRKPCSLPRKSWHVDEIVSRFLCFSNHKLWSQFSTHIMASHGLLLFSDSIFFSNNTPQNKTLSLSSLVDL